jgi:hypothetical protein
LQKRARLGWFIPQRAIKPDEKIDLADLASAIVLVAHRHRGRP